MFTQWATRRLFKFLVKKRIGRYIRGDLDLEQLDVQLGSGVAQLNDVALNVDFINDQLADLSLSLKEGSIGSITLKLQWSVLPTITVELDGLEVVFVPRNSGFKLPSKSVTFDEHSSEKQQVPIEPEVSGLGCTYMPVQEGVRVVANLVENLLLGMHVSVHQAIVAFEEHTEPNNSPSSEHSSHSMLILRFGNIEYGINSSSDAEGNCTSKDSHGEESTILTNAINFQNMTLELVDVLGDGGKVFGQPVSILQSDDSLSGSVKLSVPWKNDCIDILKLDAQISISDINLQLTMNQIQQLVAVFSAYGGNELSSSEGYDATSGSLIRHDGSKTTKENDILGSQVKCSKSSILPGTRLISDWVHWNDPDKITSEGTMSEADFTVSTEEFFDCFDGTRSSQVNLSGSGLWTWTCSALNAITAASSLASGSILVSQEPTRHTEYDVKVKISEISVRLKEQDKEHQNMNSLLDNNGEQMSNPDGRDKKLLGSWLSQSVALYTSGSCDDHIQALFSSIDISIQVSQRHLEWQLLVKEVEAFEVKYGKQNFGFPNGAMMSERIGSSHEPLQALIEQSLPKFPVSICDSRNLLGASDVIKICFLRISNNSHVPSLKINAKHNLLSCTVDKKYSQDFTHHINIYSQPVIVWFDASVVNKLHKLSAVVNVSIGNIKTKGVHAQNTGRTLPSTRSIHLDLHFPSLRFLACVPYCEGSELFKDHFLCLDISAAAEKIALLNVKLSDKVQLKNDSPCTGSLKLSLGASYLYLVSPLVKIEESKEDMVLRFTSQEVLSILVNAHEIATVEMLFRANARSGVWLAEKAWNGIMEQQRGGMAGRKMNPEFAAATATEITDEKNEKIRKDIIGCSSTYIHVVIPLVKAELWHSQQTQISEVLTSLNLISKPPTQGLEMSSLERPDIMETSVRVDVGEVKIVFHPTISGLDFVSEALESKNNSDWGKFTICVSRFQMLHVVNLGMIRNANYFWLHHGNGHVVGLLLDGVSRELQLLTLRDDALGRGDGCGGNALATSSAGMELSIISWPDGGHTEDMLVTVTIQGCTFMAHAGRLDWLPELLTFFSEQENTRPTKEAIYEKISTASESETILMLIHVDCSQSENITSSAETCFLFSLYLHDVALCYEPGKEAIAAGNLRARNTRSSYADQFAPVACSIAASTIHVSSNAISNSSCKEYQIWLRDVAVLLNDTTLSKDRVLTYTSEALRQAGYVKVAGEAVMKAVVRINGLNGLKWEVECANNQLRLDTCHDTTAALARLIAQLQQLFVPEVENPTVEKESEEACFGKDKNHTYPSDEDELMYEGILEGALTLVRDHSINAECSSYDCLQPSGKKSEKFEMLGRSDFSSDDSLYSSSDYLSHDWGELTDFCTPVSQNDEAPSFIEDYYVAKKSSPHSSQSSSWKDSVFLSHNSEHSNEDFSLPTMVEGSGGWYDGHCFNVVENHVPVANKKPESMNERGTTASASNNKRPELSARFPLSVGRVVFGDSNLRWRLYRGSDWPTARTSQTCEGRQAFLEVILNGLELQHDTFPETGHHASRLVLNIRDARIFDCSKDAPWRKVLGYHRSKSRPRESSAKALSLELESVRPDPTVPVEEYRLSVQLLPLRLHLDQRHLDFLINFFSSPTGASQQLHSGYEEIPSPNFADLEGSTFDPKICVANEDALLPFFQMCELQPFSIRVDYVPRRVDIGSLRTGNYAELFNLFSWKGIELELKRVRAARVHGWEALSGIIVGEWLEDISNNQIHKLLKGLGPIRPLCALGSGAAKLIVLPAEHYKRDRRSLFRGMRKGAMAFLRSISLEAVGLGVQIAAGAHEILLQTETALGSVGLSSSVERVDISVKVGQPGDMREGIQQACESLSRGLERTASSLIANPLKAYQRGGGTGSAVASALRAAPAAAVAPASAAAGAVHRALLGVRNSLDPEHRRESEEKHTGPPPE